jgi:hypothetical protein
MRWARIALGAIVVSTVALIGTSSVRAATSGSTARPPLTLVSQTPWVGASAPWFNLSLGVGETRIPASQLRVSLTFYGRVSDPSQFRQDAAGTPQNEVLQRVPDVPVAASSAGRTATACVTVLPDDSAVAPTPSPATSGACAAGANTVVLGCTPDEGECGDVYPVSVALSRQGSSNTLARFTTFLTYEEANQPGSVGQTGPLRVGWVVPVTGTDPSALVDDLADHRQPVTLAVSPLTASTLLAKGRAGRTTLGQLQSLTTTGGDQLVDQAYVPIDVAGLESAGLGGEIAVQLGRGDQVLRQAGLHPTGGTWVDESSNLSSGDAAALANGLAAARARTVVLSDTNLDPLQSTTYTFAHPFTLQLAHGTHFAALAADSSLDARFGGEGSDPVLAANQLLAGLSFIHFENAALDDPRGVVLVPPAGWHPSGAFVDSLLVGLTNPALSPVTLDQLTTQVHGGDGDDPSPSTRKLQSGGASGSGMSRAVVERIVQARQQLASYGGAVSGHPAVLTTLFDQVLGTESSALTRAQRTSALSAYDRRFDRLLSTVSLASEHTVTFTARTAPIPITVLSSAPYPVKVVLTVQSDKFTFPSGSRRNLTLDRSTTPVRVQARARTSGDRLPVEVTLRTPDGLLVISRATLTVHSTEISLVGIALTVVAFLVLLVWWARTWRRSRQRRPRAH